MKRSSHQSLGPIAEHHAEAQQWSRELFRLLANVFINSVMTYFPKPFTFRLNITCTCDLGKRNRPASLPPHNYNSQCYFCKNYAHITQTHTCRSCHIWTGQSGIARELMPLIRTSFSHENPALWPTMLQGDRMSQLLPTSNSIRRYSSTTFVPATSRVGRNNVDTKADAFLGKDSVGGRVEAWLTDKITCDRRL